MLIYRYLGQGAVLLANLGDTMSLRHKSASPRSIHLSLRL